MAEHVTVAALTALLGPATDPARAQVAVDAANQLVTLWVGLGADGVPPAAATPTSSQAGLELAQTLYRRHVATGGFVGVDELLARLPANLVTGIRDLLDADTHYWGLA